MAKGKDKEEFTEVSDVLLDFLDNAVEDLRRSLETVRGGRGANASGDLSQSIAENLQNGVEQTRAGFSMSIELNDYYTDVDEGQPVGTKVSKSSILQWLNDKPNLIPRAPKLPDDTIAYLITRKILRKGAEATHFYSDVMTKQRIDKLYSDLEKAGAIDVQNNMDKLFE